MSLFEEVKQTVGTQLGIGPHEIMEESFLLDELGADSLDMVELVMALEERFGIDIPDEDAEKIRTIADAVQYIENKRSQVQMTDKK